MRCGKRCTSCGQPTATAILPAQYRAAASSGTSTTAKPPRCSLVSTNGPSVKRGEPPLGSTLHTTVDASRPPSLKTKTPATVISSIRALADVALSRSSSSVRSGTHSSLKAIRYSAISSSSAHGQPGRLPLTLSTNALASIRHPRPRSFPSLPHRSRSNPSGNVGFPPQRRVRRTGDHPSEQRQLAAIAGTYDGSGSRSRLFNTARMQPILPHDGTGPAAAPLSAREAQIAGLVAQGSTNPQIAAQLHLSRRTVENHLQHIF